MKVKKIIDWDSIYYGSEYEDLCYIIWLWCNFGSLVDNNKVKLSLTVNTIKYILKKYKYLNLEKLNTQMLKLLKNRKETRTSNIYMNYEEITFWYNYCIDWWNKNFKIIRKTITNERI